MTKRKFKNTSTYYNTAPESNFTLIPNQIIRARFLSINARLLYMEIISKPNDYIINLERMYADLGIPQKSGAKAFRELEKCGLVNREKRGNSYHYDVSNFDYSRLDTPKLTGPIVSTTNTESTKT